MRKAISGEILACQPIGCGSADAMTSDDPGAVSARLQEDVRFRVLRLLEQHPELSQRQIAQELGIALGRVNFLLRALIAKGLVKARNFRTAQNRLRYAYVLTPQGLAHRTTLTRGFLQRKIAEYEALSAEIEALRSEVPEVGEQAEPAHRPSDRNRLREAQSGIHSHAQTK